MELPPWSKIIDIDEYITELIDNELPPWSEEIDIDEYIRELEIEETNRDCGIIDIDEYIAELEIMKIKQEYPFIDIDDELPPWSEIIDIDDHIDELETAEFFESQFSEAENDELIATDDVDKWEMSVFWDKLELREYLRMRDVGVLE